MQMNSGKCLSSPFPFFPLRGRMGAGLFPSADGPALAAAARGGGGCTASGASVCVATVSSACCAPCCFLGFRFFFFLFTPPPAAACSTAVWGGAGFSTASSTGLNLFLERFCFLRTGWSPACTAAAAFGDIAGATCAETPQQSLRVGNGHKCLNGRPCAGR